MKLKIESQKIKVIEEDFLVSGSQGLYTVEFEFSDDWANFEKTILFAKRFSDESIAVILDGDSMPIPSEIIADSNELIIGVYGINGDYVKPTVWSEPIKIEVGCKEGATILSPAPDVYTQIMSLVSDCTNNVDAILATQPFVVTFTYNGVSTVADKTIDEIYSAYQDGKYILAKLVSAAEMVMAEYSVGFNYSNVMSRKQFTFYFSPRITGSSSLYVTANRTIAMTQGLMSTTITYSPTQKQIQIVE